MGLLLYPHRQGRRVFFVDIGQGSKEKIRYSPQPLIAVFGTPLNIQEEVSRFRRIPVDNPFRTRRRRSGDRSNQKAHRRAGRITAPRRLTRMSLQPDSAQSTCGIQNNHHTEQKG